MILPVAFDIKGTRADEGGWSSLGHEPVTSSCSQRDQKRSGATMLRQRTSVPTGIVSRSMITARRSCKLAGGGQGEERLTAHICVSG